MKTKGIKFDVMDTWLLSLCAICFSFISVSYLKQNIELLKNFYTLLQYEMLLFVAIIVYIVKSKNKM